MTVDTDEEKQYFPSDPETKQPLLKGSWVVAIAIAVGIAIAWFAFADDSAETTATWESTLPEVFLSPYDCEKFTLSGEEIQELSGVGGKQGIEPAHIACTFRYEISRTEASDHTTRDVLNKEQFENYIWSLNRSQPLSVFVERQYDLRARAAANSEFYDTNYCDVECMWGRIYFDILSNERTFTKADWEAIEVCDIENSSENFAYFEALSAVDALLETNPEAHNFVCREMNFMADLVDDRGMFIGSVYVNVLRASGETSIAHYASNLALKCCFDKDADAGLLFERVHSEGDNTLQSVVDAYGFDEWIAVEHLYFDQIVDLSELIDTEEE